MENKIFLVDMEKKDKHSIGDIKIENGYTYVYVGDSSPSGWLNKEFVYGGK